MLSFSKKTKRLLVWTGFSLQLFVLINVFFNIPEPVAWVYHTFCLFIVYKFCLKKENYRHIDKTGMVLTFVFILWLLIEFIIACFHAQGYWMWKRIISNLFLTLFFIVIILGSNAFFIHGIYRLFWKFYLPLIILSITLFHTPNFLNYLPYSTLLLFWGLIPKNKRGILTIIVLVFFTFQEQRNDLIKMLMAGIIGIIISYLYDVIPKWSLKILQITFLISPLILVSLGATGKFNVFDMDSYIEGDYSQTVKDFDGKEVQDNLKGDTRSFIYINVAYTLDKYNAWLLGRSPAYGDEGPLGVASQIDKTTNLKGRYGNEVQIMNILLWYGIIGGFLYFLIYARASYLAVFKSCNKYVKGIGIYVAFLWMWSFVWEITNFEIYFMMNIIFLGVCFSKKIREMNESDMKIWVRNIFINS